MKTKRFLLKTTSIITLVAFFISTTGCSSYFRIRQEKNISSQKIEEYQNHHKYVILHSNNNAWHIHNYFIQGDTIIGYLNPWLDYHVDYLTPSFPKGTNRYLKRTEPDVIKEVHIYTSDTAINILDTCTSIQLSSIEKIEIYQYASGASTISWVIPIVGVVTISYVMISLWALAQML